MSTRKKSGRPKRSAVERSLRRLAPNFDATLSLRHLEHVLTAAGHEPAIAALPIVRAARSQPAALAQQLAAIGQACQANWMVAQQESVAPGYSPPLVIIRWQTLLASRAVQPHQLLVYFTCLIRLAGRNQNVLPVDRRIGLRAARTYVQLQLVPGAQQCGLFDAELLADVFGLISLLALLQADAETQDAAGLAEAAQRVELVADCWRLWRDCGQMLRAVRLSGYSELRRTIVRAATRVMVHYRDDALPGRYSQQLYDQCFTIFSLLCREQHGDTIANLHFILNGTGALIRFGGTDRVDGTGQPCRTLRDWFVEQLSDYPLEVGEVLTHYVKAILSSGSIGCAGPLVLAANMTTCVQFELALWQLGSDELLEYLVDEVALAEDALQRIQAVEFATRLLEAPVELLPPPMPLPLVAAAAWPPATEASDAREVRLMDLLLRKMLDIDDGIKVLAIRSFMRLTVTGNQMWMWITGLIFLPKTIEEDAAATAAATATTATAPRHQPDTVPRGVESLYNYRHDLLRICRHHLTSDSDDLRQSAILLLDFLAHTDCDLDEFLRSDELRLLHTDPAAAVRQQLVLTFDMVLNARPASPSVQDAYVALAQQLAGEADGAVTGPLFSGLRRWLLAAIAPAKQTETERAWLPWRLAKRMLAGDGGMPNMRPYIGGWVQLGLVPPLTVANIETHLATGYSLEAWSLLAQLSAHQRSARPQLVATALLLNIRATIDQRPEMELAYAQLEVLANWLDDVPPVAQISLLRQLDEVMAAGQVAGRLIGRTFEICRRLGQRHLAEVNGGGGGGGDSWTESIRERSLRLVLMRLSRLHVGNVLDARLVNGLFVYAEAMVRLPRVQRQQPEQLVVQFLFDFLELVAVRKSNLSSDAALMSKVNIVQSVLTKFSLASRQVCASTLPYLGAVLNSIKLPAVVITSITCLGDIFKQYPTLSPIGGSLILSRTRHAVGSVRAAAIAASCLLLLDGCLRLRGMPFVYMLAAISDERDDCRQMAGELLLKCRDDDNPLLLRTGLLAAPFLLTGYQRPEPMSPDRPEDGGLRSPVAGVGAAQREARRYAYRFLVHHVRREHLYRYFGNVRLVADKLTAEGRQTVLGRPEGWAMLLDFVYILAHICESLAADRRRVDEAGQAAAEAELAEGRRMVAEALPLIAAMAMDLRPLDAAGSWGPAVDRLGWAVCGYFGRLAAAAEPRAFWAQYVRLPEQLVAAGGMEAEAEAVGGAGAEGGEAGAEGGEAGASGASGAAGSLLQVADTALKQAKLIGGGRQKMAGG